MVNYAATDGWVSPYPNGTTFPGTTMNFPASATTAMGTTVSLPVDQSGKIKFQYAGTSGATIDLMVDVVGYYTATSGDGAFTPAAVRVISGLQVAANATVKAYVAGRAGIPAAGSGITAIAANVQVTRPSAAEGNLHLWSSDQTNSLSILNYTGSATRSNFVTFRVGSDGAVNIQNNSSVAVGVYVDVQGWYTSLSDTVVQSGQTSTQKSVGLRARPNGTSPVIYQYRKGAVGDFAPVQLGDLSDSDDNSPSAWPLALTGSGSSAAFTPYTWNIASTLNALAAGSGSLNSLIQVEACFGTSLTDVNLVCSMPSNISYTPGNFADASATTSAGPGTLALGTGNFQVSATDAAAATSVGGLSIGRSATTLAPASAKTGAPGTGESLDPAGIFGAGWRADLAGSDAGGADLAVTPQLAKGFISFTSPDGWVGLYQATSAVASYPVSFAGVGDAGTDGSTVTMVSAKVITMADADGTVTTWKLQGTPATWQSTSVAETGSNTSTTYSYSTEAATRGLVSRITAPAPAGVSCTSAPDTAAGCRSLTLTYATPSGAPVGTQRLSTLNLSVPTASGSSQITPVVSYAYDTAARLIQAWDPRSSVAVLKTSYAYVGSVSSTGTNFGRLASVTSPGMPAWQLAYNSQGLLTTVSRVTPVGNPVSGTTTKTATTTFVYDVATSGTALPTLTKASAATWGQTSDVPVKGGGTAVFSADHVPAGTTSANVADGDWRYATIHYLDVNGREVNTANYGGGVNASTGGVGTDAGWIIDTTQYDTNGNAVWTLDGGARSEALGAGADTDPAAAALSSPAAAALLATDTVYSVLDPSLVTDTFGPIHPVALASGTVVDARTHTHTDYDEGAPNEGINPVTRAGYRLATTTTTRPWNVASSQDVGVAGTSDMSITRQGYDAVGSMSSLAALPVPNPQMGEATSVPVTGWALGVSTTSTVQLGVGASSANDLVTTTIYDGDGRAIETRLPGDSTGTTTRTTKATYFTATGSGSCVSPIAAGMVCQTAPADQPGTGAALAITTTAYNAYGNPTTVTETYGTASGAPARTTTMTYDDAERATKTAVTLAGVSGSVSIPDVSQSYDPATGLPTVTSTGSGSTATTLTTTYNSVGAVSSYADASGAVTYTGYDIDGRAVSTVDAKGSTTATFDTDGEHRGLLTVQRHANSPTSGDALGSSGATTDSGALDLTSGSSADSVFGFTATYGADGSASRVVYPNGMSSWSHVDSAGNETGLTYGTGTSGSGLSNLVAFTATIGGLGQTIGQDSMVNGVQQSKQVYMFDGASRLTMVDDTVYSGAGGATAACSRRAYGFDAHSNRTSLSSSAAASACSSSGGSTVTSAFDAGDRITGMGYTYDSLGRTLTVPASDAVGTGTHASATGTATVTYADNDMVATLSQGSGAAAQVQQFTLDPSTTRIETQTTTTGATGSATVAAVANHFGGGSDSPSWTSTTTTSAGGSATSGWTSNLIGPDGNLAAIISGDGTGVAGASVALQIVNLHGDVCATVPALGAPTSITNHTETTEYGIPRDVSTAKAPYGWVGAKLRSSGAASGLILMGVRLYSPAIGRFLSVDPVPGGNPNAYTYPVDPVNGFDLNGQFNIGRLASKAANFVKENRVLLGVGIGLITIGVCAATAGVGCTALTLISVAVDAANGAANCKGCSVTKKAGSAAKAGAVSYGVASMTAGWQKATFSSGLKGSSKTAFKSGIGRVMRANQAVLSGVWLGGCTTKC